MNNKINNNLPAEISTVLLQLNEAQLIQLNRMIVERLKLFHKAKHLKAMSEFNIGDTVSFNYEGREVIGKIQRLNQKSVTIITNDGRIWKVSPNFLNKFIDV